MVALRMVAAGGNRGIRLGITDTAFAVSGELWPEVGDGVTG